jgi:phosphoribosyl-ATP pyrophosphohydrolase
MPFVLGSARNDVCRFQPNCFDLPLGRTLMGPGRPRLTKRRACASRINDFLDICLFWRHNGCFRLFPELPCLMFSLDDLARTIALRATAGAEKSYTSALLEKGPRGAAKKFGEEAVELAIAAVSEDDEALRGEAADVLYHLLVVLKSREITLSQVLDVLERRSARSGHEEKASRRS